MSSIDPEMPPAAPELPSVPAADAAPTEPPALFAAPGSPTAIDRIHDRLLWTFVGDQGLRAGWSVMIFYLLALPFAGGGLFDAVLQFAFFKLHLLSNTSEMNASTVFFSDLTAVLAMLGAGVLIAFLERRRLLDYNLTGLRRLPHFFSGALAGFVAFSVLLGALAAGGWMHFGPVALSGAAIFQRGAMWAAAFLLVGFFEEGAFRCYLQFTLTRGINFWGALGIVGALCLRLILHSRGNGVWGVYAAALLGLLPCLILYLRNTPRSGFWQAAWVTSTLFGFIHTGNGGEDPVGIFAAAMIGFIFCVSIRLTGSAWWAIGCHAAWDWTETYFYGAIDSGYVATGHFLSTSPAGNPLYSGGTAGPEGSILLLAILGLLLAALLLLYGPRKPRSQPALGYHESNDR